MEDPKKQLKQLRSKKTDEELSDCLSCLATCLVMGTESYLRSFDVREGITAVTSILEKYAQVRTYGDTMVMSFRVLALFLEHAPSSSSLCHKLHPLIIQLTSSAMHAALCYEWKHSHTDTAMLLEEGLRVIRFVAVADLTGSMLENVLVGDVLTLCTSVEDPLVTRGAIEALHSLCAKVILPSELDTGILSSFLSLFESSSSTTKTIVKNAMNPMVVSIEKIISPFLVTMIEQLCEAVETAPDLWFQLELVLQCLGKLIDRSLLCHRHSTARAIVTPELPKLLFHLILRIEHNVVLESSVRTSRLLLCESILSGIAYCNRELLLNVMTEWEARTFFTSILTQSMADGSTLLDDPFSIHYAASSTGKRRRDNDHITFIAGIRLFVLACPNIPPAAFGLRPEVLLSVHRWKWEDELHQLHNFSEEHCVTLECAYNRLEKSCDLPIGKSTEEVDFHAMIIRRGLRDGYRNLQRVHIPFAFQYVDESALRPIRPVKETGPEVSGSPISSVSSSKFVDASYDIINSEAVVSENNVHLAEIYFEMLCTFASKGLGNVVRLLSINACASLLHMLLISRERMKTRNLVAKTMLPLCAVIDEALAYRDLVSNAIALTMTKWLLNKENQMKWYFSVTFQRCGLLKKLKFLSSFGSDGPSKGNRKAIQKLASNLHRVITEKLKCSAIQSQIGQTDVNRLASSVATIRSLAETPGIHEEAITNFFDALSADVTVYEAFQMQIAGASLSYLLNGKSLQDIFGQSLVYSSEGYGSSRDITTTRIQHVFFAVKDEEPFFLEKRIQISDLIMKHLDEPRIECFINCGFLFRSNFQKMIKLLTSTLPLDVHLPLVECLISSERTECKNPTSAFMCMSEISPKVRLCIPIPTHKEKEETGSSCRKSMSAHEEEIRNLQSAGQSQLESTTGRDTNSVAEKQIDIGKFELRCHLMSSVGDIERLLRTGSASTKNTYAAPTTQSALQNVEVFLRRVEIFLKDIVLNEPSDSKDRKVALQLLKSNEQNSILLLSLVYAALSKYYTRGVLQNRIPGLPVPQGVVDNLIAKEDKEVAEKLIEEAFEKRYVLFRNYSGPCNYHRTFFSVLFTEAFNTRNKKMLMQLERMIVTYEEKSTNCIGPSTTPPQSLRNPMTRSDHFLYPTATESEVVFTEQDNVINRNVCCEFHSFEGTNQQQCYCEKFSRESFSTEDGNEFTIQFPPIAYREDISLLAIIHNYLAEKKLLSEISTVGSENDLFFSTSLTTLVVRAAAKSALRVALLPAKFALPRWVHFIFSNAKFLLPLSAREKLCRFMAYGARRALLRYLRRQTHLRSGVGTTVSELARFSNHKFSVDRNRLQHDSLMILRKAADSRLPVSVEFKGDVGVGQGPTAQFYTLLSKELCKTSQKIWNRATTVEDVRGTNISPVDAMIVPPPEGLYPLIQHVTEFRYQREKCGGKVVLTDRVPNCISEAVIYRNCKRNAYYIVGIALGRSFLDGHVLPLHLSTALFTFLRWGTPPFRVVVRDCESSKGAEFPIDLFHFTLDHAKLIDESVASSIESLAQCDESTLQSLQIPFTLPGDDNFELIKDGKNVFVSRKNLAKYQQRVVSSLMYESVAVPIKLITAGFSDVVPREALAMLDAPEISRLLCGEMRSPTEALWTLEEMRTVLVGDHGYQNDSLQIEMLADVLCNRLTPKEQQAFLFFATGCPRLPLGGICAMGAITVVKRTDAFGRAREESHLDDDGEGEGEEGDDIEHFTSSTEATPQFSPALTSAKTMEDFGGSRVESDWALPSVNTCFRYIKLPPYPNTDLMHKKLLLSITHTGDTFELS